MQALLAQETACGLTGEFGPSAKAGSGSGAHGRVGYAGVAGKLESVVPPVSLRTIIERSSGLLSRVCGGGPVEITYGSASMVPVRVAEDAVERILVNLVQNSAAALASCGPLQPGLGNAAGTSAWALERAEGAAGVATPIGIRIGVGQLSNRVGDAKPWPFRRVRLTVEDSGCGMAPEQLDRLLCGTRAPSRGSHGIGFRVVRDLVAASGGDLCVKSTPGIGTRVQIEWQMAEATAADSIEPTSIFKRAGSFAANSERRQSC